VTSSDWMEEAAIEIAADVRHGDGNEEDYRDIIARHCPFKPDHAYVEVDDEYRRQLDELTEIRKLLDVAQIPSGAPIMSVTLPVRQIGETTFSLLQRVAYAVHMLRKDPPLLQCISCKNTESCAGAMARELNKGRCLHCGSYFKVVRA
jgi:hypothetical protein